MHAHIDSALGVDDNPLGKWAAERISVSAGRAACRRDFDALRAAVVLAAPDKRLTVTLRFDQGRLTIHDGMVGTPDLTFCGDYDVLTGLGRLRLSRRGRLPLPPLGTADRVAWRSAVQELVSGELKIYGLWRHPRTVVRLLRLLQAPPDSRSAGASASAPPASTTD